MSDARRFKSAMYEQLARLGKGLAAPKRLELLDLLSQAPRTVEALANASEIGSVSPSFRGTKRSLPTVAVRIV